MEGALNRMMSGVADFALGLAPEDVPEGARRDAALMLLDTLGVAAAASPMEAGRIARDTANLLYGSGDPAHRARMLFDGREVSLAGAAYAAATQTDNLDAHDGYNPVKGHIGVAVIPALLALAEQAEPMSGAEALMLVTLGYEIAGRAGLALHATVSDYHTSGAWNALGVAAMASRLRGLSAQQLREAIGIAEYHGPRSQMMREIANPSMLHDGSGWGAMVGISSAILAERGFTGAPAITVEAEEAAPFWSDLGSRWVMQAQYVKPYPICRWAHAPIDGVRDLMLAHGLGPDDIGHIRINTFHESACLFQGVPDSTSMAQYSLSFAVATQAAHGCIGVGQVSGEGLRDPAVHAMIDRISVAESEAHNATFPHTRDADVQITLNDGRVLDSGLVHARGGSERPMDEAEIIGKFGDYAAPVIGADRARAIVAAVTGMADGTAGLDDLRAHLYAPA
ncbi:MAG: MmgE/PrpD family protein [Pseudomonadota bacterium]|nr:MmgE/PrpD family protein [Pseudomonadota bacterium]